MHPVPRDLRARLRPVSPGSSIWLHRGDHHRGRARVFASMCDPAQALGSRALRCASRRTTSAPSPRPPSARCAHVPAASLTLSPRPHTSVPLATFAGLSRAYDARGRGRDQVSHLGHRGAGEIPLPRANVLPRCERSGARVRHHEGGTATAPAPAHRAAAASTRAHAALCAL